MSKDTSSAILLDTHAWIWLINGDREIKKPGLLDLIQKKSETGGIYVSIMSVWEVGMLEAKGRISLPFAIEEWVERALSAPGISLTPLTPEIATASSRLEGKFGGDPVDRILLATAKRIKAILVTRDSEILSYAKKYHLATLAC